MQHNPELVGQLLLEAKELCDIMEYDLTFSYRRVIARSRENPMFMLIGHGPTIIVRLSLLIEKLRVAYDTTH